MRFAQNSSGMCLAVIFPHDPATGVDSTFTHPAGDPASLITPPATTDGATASPLGGHL